MSDVSVFPNNKIEKHGFTLIEMSIVIIIIGLFIGSILVGQDLINSAAIRSQISQIQKYQTAVRTFQGKYGYLPGDIPDPYATQFGFQPRGPYRGQGDGNGIIEGNWDNITGYWGTYQASGETRLFWGDLGAANLIESNYGNPNYHQLVNTINGYYPTAQIGNANYLYAYSLGKNGTGGLWQTYNINYFGVSVVTGLDASHGEVISTLGMTVKQAYNIDTKIDDGIPISGNVQAIYINTDNTYYANWVYLGGAVAAPTTLSFKTSTAGSSTTCFDNGATWTKNQTYSTSQNSNNFNCALSFQF